MAQRQFKSDDTSIWVERFGSGIDGAFAPTTSTDSVANTTASGTETTSTLTVGSGSGFADGDLILIHQSRNGGDGAGVWELNKIASGASTTTWTLSYPLCNDYGTTAQVYLLKEYSSVNVAGGETLSGRAWNGTTGGIIAFVCSGDVTIAGTISVNGTGFRKGASGDNSSDGFQAEGTAGAGGTQNNRNPNGNGGGAGEGGEFFGGGGGGGGAHATSGGSAGTAGTEGQGGIGGDVVGNAALTIADFGGGGGGAGSFHGGSNAGEGGVGGGFILIIGKTITITGSLSSNGTNGETGTAGDAGGGGGGAGGSILIKGQSLTLGSSLVTASAGSGGGFNGSGSTGGAGGVGRIHADYSTILSGTTSPTIDSTVDAVFIDPRQDSYFIFM